MFDYASILLLAEKELENTRRALECVFSMHDMDGNGIITFPEFTKMALGFCTEQELHDTKNVSKMIFIKFL